MGTAVEDTVTPGHATSATRPGVWLTDLALLMMTLIWSVNFSVVKYGVQLVDPLAYNGVRVALAAVTLVLIVVLTRAPWPPLRTSLVLLGLGANVDFQDSKKMTALHYMLKKGSDKTAIKMLVDHGARGDLKNKDGVTAAEIMLKKKDPDYRAMAARLAVG